MKATIYTVNEKGLEEIRGFLSANHARCGDYIPRDMLEAYARDAEFQLGEGNGARIEIRALNSISKCPVCYTISDEGLDSEVIEIDE